MTYMSAELDSMNLTYSASASWAIDTTRPVGAAYMLVFLWTTDASLPTQVFINGVSLPRLAGEFASSSTSRISVYGGSATPLVEGVADTIDVTRTEAGNARWVASVLYFTEELVFVTFEAHDAVPAVATLPGETVAVVTYVNDAVTETVPVTASLEGTIESYSARNEWMSVYHNTDGEVGDVYSLAGQIYPLIVVIYLGTPYSITRVLYPQA